jgi:toxin ParE1/3/4
MPRFHIRPGAEADVDQAFAWYEAQREGLGLEFLTAVEAAFALITRSPDTFPKVYRDVRRVLVRKFPYAVFYTTSPEDVSVLACVHARRHPRRWQSRR